MNTDDQRKAPENKEELNSLVIKYTHAATNVLKCGTGQEGIVRYLRYEKFSDDDSVSLSYPLFNKAKKRLNRTQMPKAIIAISLMLIGIVGPIILYFSNFGFVVASSIPIIAGYALWRSVIRAKPLPEANKIS